MPWKRRAARFLVRHRRLWATGLAGPSASPAPRLLLVFFVCAMAAAAESLLAFALRGALGGLASPASPLASEDLCAPALLSSPWLEVPDALCLDDGYGEVLDSDDGMKTESESRVPDCLGFRLSPAPGFMFSFR